MNFQGEETSRERPNSASYSRLKNIAGTTMVKLLSHSTKKYPKWFSPNLENSFFSELETSEKTCLWEKIFSKKVFGKKSRILPKNMKETLKAHKMFLTN